MVLLMHSDSFPTEERPSDPAAGRPPHSRLRVERFEDGLTVQIDPPGLRGGLLVMLIGGAVSVLIATLFLVSAVLRWAEGRGKVDGGDLLGSLLLFLFLSGGGLALILTSLHLARRRAAVAVTGGMLMAMQTGLWGSKQREWQPGEVLAVRVAPSGIEVNNKPVLELQIVDAHGRKFSMLAGHQEDDLTWLERELRRALGLSGTGAAPHTAGEPDEWEPEENEEA